MRLVNTLAPLAAVSLWAAAGAALASPTAAATAGRCSPGSGVTVVVDPGQLGGGTELGCDPKGAGAPASTVVPRAGFPLTYVSGEPFVCRVDGLPDASQETCSDTPPADAYWALFWSDGKSTTWKYATVGVSGLSVPKGGSIGWRFEDGGAREDPSQPPTQTPDEPSPSPSQSPKPSRSPRPTPSAAPQARVPSPARSASTPPSSSAPPAGVAGTRRPPSTSRPTAAVPSLAGHAGDAHGKGATATPADPADHPNAPHHDKPRRREKRVVASSDMTGTAVSTSGQEVLTAVAASSIVLLGAAVGVAGWRRRS